MNFSTSRTNYHLKLKWTLILFLSVPIPCSFLFWKCPNTLDKGLYCEGSLLCCKFTHYLQHSQKTHPKSCFWSWKCGDWCWLFLLIKFNLIFQSDLLIPKQLITFHTWWLSSFSSSFSVLKVQTVWRFCVHSNWSDFL